MEQLNGSLRQIAKNATYRLALPLFDSPGPEITENANGEIDLMATSTKIKSLLSMCTCPR